MVLTWRGSFVAMAVALLGGVPSAVATAQEPVAGPAAVSIRSGSSDAGQVGTVGRVGTVGKVREVRGAPVNTAPQTLVQPDGTSFTARQRGDAARHWWTVGNATVARDTAGTWRFATRLDRAGQPAASGSRVTRNAAAPSAAKGLRPARDRVDAPESALPRMGVEGPQKTLVILAQFLNRSSVGTTAAQWNARFFGATDSVRSFYRTASSNQLDITPATESSGTVNDGVVGWVTLPMNHPNYFDDVDGRAWAVTAAAVTAANPFVDFAAYDTDGSGVVEPDELHVTVIAAGYEGSYGGTTSCTPNVWGHQWAIDSGAPTVDGKVVGRAGYTQFGESHCDVSDPTDAHQATIGIMAHELGHDLGWPDLYDIDQSSSGIGEWSLMAAGSWGTKPSSVLPGDAPTLPDAWSRSVQGWVDPVEVVGTRSVDLTQVQTTDGVYRLLPNPNGPEFSWTGSGRGEYFLVENRQPSGADVALPGCGLVVYHVQENQPDNSVDTDRLVDVVEADGLEGLDDRFYRGGPGDAWHGAAGQTRLSSTTTPSTRLNNGASTPAAMTATGGCASTMAATLTGTPKGGRFVAQTPTRVLDTRTGTGVPEAPVGPGATVTLTVPGLPADTTAVTLNLTGTGPTASTFVTAWPAGTTRPNASNLNLAKGATDANLVTVKVGPGGKVSFWNASGSTHLIADLAGYYSPSASAAYSPGSPSRVLDTRTGTGVPQAPVGAGELVTLTVPGLPADATAVTLNLTGTGPTASTYVTAWPAGTTRPNASNLNLAKGATDANLVTVKVGAGGKVSFWNAGGSTHLIADLAGYYSPSAPVTYYPGSPARILDTRTGTGVPKAPVGAGATVTLTIPGLPADATAVTLNLTGTGPTASTFVTAWPSGTTRPNASNLNLAKGATDANLVTVKVGTGGRVSFRNASGSTHLIGDLAGYFRP
ncbi:M6 family metalloprotease domain-containing protein [Knoellia sp. CPCC 206450]|uniref:M6 family metalloprotease domain-containing protein n=1 Tax=Knoellia tibetensis TaxID=3404798 RepID=UPI003B42C98E